MADELDTQEVFCRVRSRPEAFGLLEVVVGAVMLDAEMIASSSCCISCQAVYPPFLPMLAFFEASLLPLAAAAWLFACCKDIKIVRVNL